MSDRIHVLNNGRSPAKKSGDFITRGEAEAMVLAERAENEKMVRWYLTQLPELVAKMLGDALAVNGLVMKAPESVGPEIVSAPDACAICHCVNDCEGAGAEAHRRWFNRIDMPKGLL